MAGENHTVRMTIDGSGAKRGAAAYTSAVNQIAGSMQKLRKVIQDSTMAAGGSSAFKKIAGDLSSLNSVRINPSLGKNLEAVSLALRRLKSPDPRAIRSLRDFANIMGGVRVSAGVARNLSDITLVLNTFRGPTAMAVKNTQALFHTLNHVRMNAGSITALNSVSQVLASVRAPSAAAARNIQAFVTAISQLRAPANMAGLTALFNSIGNATNRTNASVVRFSGSLNAVPWRRAQMGAVGLTGSMRGLENAFSASYQLGTQLRMLFGALTLSGFTNSVYSATLELERFRNVLGVTITDTAELGDVMDGVQSISRRFGIDINTVYQEFGKFNTAAQLSGATTEEVMATFENMSGSMRVMGLDAGRQRLVWLALTQMFSKGKVQAEELRRQLGEQIPAAFNLMQSAIREFYDDPTLSLDQLMMDGAVSSDAVFLLVNKIGEAFGGQFQNAMERADTAVGNLANSWTYFLQTVGDQGGVFNAIGDVAEQLTLIMEGPDFKSLAEDIGTGLSGAIRQAGDAAAWLITNAREVAKWMATAFGAVMARQVLSMVGAIGGIVLALNPITAILGTITLAITGAAAATVYFWNEQVNLGNSIVTVGEIATAIFSLTVQWLQTAGQAAVNFGLDLVDAFDNSGKASQKTVQGMYGDWRDWGNFVISIFDRMREWLVLIGQLIGGFVANVVMLGQQMKNLATLDFDRFNATGDAWLEMNQRMGETMEQTIENAWHGRGDYLGKAYAGIMAPIGAAAEAVEKEILKAREIAAEPIKVDVPEPFTPATIDPSGLNPVIGGDEDDDSANAVADRIDSIKAAVQAYQSELARLNGALKNGLITQEMYNNSLAYFKGILEESTDPYQALIRSLQEENQLLSMNSEEQEIARRMRDITNDLMSKGVDLTREQTAAIEELVKAQYELENVRPFEEWVRGLEDFADSVDSVAVNALEGLSEEIANFVVTGKADFKSLAQSILKEFIQSGIQKFFKDTFSTWFEKPEVTVNEAAPSVTTPEELAAATERGTYSGVVAAMADQGIGGRLEGARSDERDRSGRRKVWEEGGSQTYKADLDSIDAAVNERMTSAVDLASEYLGQHEERNNSNVNAFLKRGGVDIDAAQTAWCAGFVNSALEQVGVTGTGSLTANSFQNWGTAVDPTQAMRGDVLVQDRGLGPSDAGGHVGFATGQQRMLDGQLQLQMLGGNQSNAVTEKWVNASEVMVRRAEEAAANIANASAQGVETYRTQMTNANQQIATDLTQKTAQSQASSEVTQQFAQDFQPANAQVANDYVMRMSMANQQIAAGVGGVADGAAAGLGNLTNAIGQTGQTANQTTPDLFGIAQGIASLISGGSGGGGSGDIFGMIGSIAGLFFDTGGVVGASGGKRKTLSQSSIVGDPDAEPIVAHRGELITPAHQVRQMQRMGDDAMLVDNQAVAAHDRRRSSGDAEDAGFESGYAGGRGQVNNFNMTVNTPDANSFGRSEGQIRTKMMNKLARAGSRNK